MTIDCFAFLPGLPIGQEEIIDVHDCKNKRKVLGFTLEWGPGHFKKGRQVGSPKRL
jgi:hypothetical protein